MNKFTTNQFAEDTTAAEAYEMREEHRRAENRRQNRRRRRRRWQTPPARVKEKRTIAEAPRRCVEGILFFFSSLKIRSHKCLPSQIVLPFVS